MALIAGVLKENSLAERRVAIVPRVVDLLKKSSVEVYIETEAGLEAGFTDDDYRARGAHVVAADEVRSRSQILLCVRVPELLDGLSAGTAVIGFCDPLTDLGLVARYAQAGLTLFSMEFVPRITRAQSMDALSSMASIAGYKAVLLAAVTLPRLFPMMTTAAGTMPPARVLILGAGVAGLQAIATARRLGAVVSGYDVRAAVKEQIESLGAKFVVIDLGVKGEGEGGYARALDEATIQRQREQMALVMKEQDVVITTAAVPGKKAPVLITREMVHAMNPGSVIVDLAAERGGNCELTRPGETVMERGVTVLGPVNVPATVPRHASEMYARNIATLLKNMINKEGKLNIDLNDEITRDTLVTRGGEVVNAKVQALLGVNA
ncbi:MAG TPA: Re/Si-specific NAD(P)(+) transhydrogenase subunit alpha [Bryobacteraceae bacterium]|nr:Re/Si-specific NAD(P)(+) transhydrogenase subunit alpha [Bryobacteraceae bacterium]